MQELLYDSYTTPDLGRGRERINPLESQVEGVVLSG
jgi:hypothetical protein